MHTPHAVPRASSATAVVDSSRHFPSSSLPADRVWSLQWRSLRDDGAHSRWSQEGVRRRRRRRCKHSTTTVTLIGRIHLPTPAAIARPSLFPPLRLSPIHMLADSSSSPCACLHCRAHQPSRKLSLWGGDASLHGDSTLAAARLPVPSRRDHDPTSSSSSSSPADPIRSDSASCSIPLLILRLIRRSLE
jgi:hypothetical protein